MAYEKTSTYARAGPFNRFHKRTWVRLQCWERTLQLHQSCQNYPKFASQRISPQAHLLIISGPSPHLRRHPMLGASQSQPDSGLSKQNCTNWWFFRLKYVKFSLDVWGGCVVLKKPPHWYLQLAVVEDDRSRDDVLSCWYSGSIPSNHQAIAEPSPACAVICPHSPSRCLGLESITSPALKTAGNG